MSGKTALIIGATGATGQYLLKELLTSSHFTKVGEYGRRLTDLSTLSTGKDKLVQKAIDFEKLEESGIKDGKWDVVFITLGTTRKAAGSAEGFQKIDRDYVVNSAKEARVLDLPQRVVYLSNTKWKCRAIAPTPKSSLLYSRSKGQTEEALANIGYSDTIVFRPGLLTGAARPDSRIAESIAEYKVATLGKSIAIAGSLGSEKLPPIAQAAEEKTPEGNRFVSIPNAGAAALAQTPLE
ncbi:hypothetical protein F5146DRAFT_1002566 [Armillaria mellea]|nr:hypothetical protein F5146DRAFT_1002566 [Armillaria mellea]